MSPEFEKFLMEKMENLENGFAEYQRKRVKIAIRVFIGLLIFFAIIIGLCFYLS